MTCEEYKEQISLFTDGELLPGEFKPLFEHLPGCADCRAFLGVLMKVRKVATAEEIPFPEELDERIFSRIDEKGISPVSVRPGRSSLWGRRLSWSTGFAAAAIILALVVGGVVGSFLSGQRSQDITSPTQVRLAEQGHRPAAVLIIYSLPEIQSTGIVPAKYERVQSDTIF